MHIDSACVLEKKRGTKNVHIFHKSWGGKIKGKKIKLLKHVFALYSLPTIFSKIFSLATLARLRFILHLKMQPCNVLYQPHLYIIFYFLLSLSLTASFQNSLKTRIKLYKMSNIVCGVAESVEKT